MPLYAHDSINPLNSFPLLSLSEEAFQASLQKGDITSPAMISECVRYLDYLTLYKTFPPIVFENNDPRILSCDPALPLCDAQNDVVRLCHLFVSSNRLVSKVRDVAFANKHTVGKKDPLKTLYKTFVRCRDVLKDDIAAPVAEEGEDDECRKNKLFMFHYMESQAEKNPDSFAVRSHPDFHRVNAMKRKPKKSKDPVSSDNNDIRPIFIDEETLYEKNYLPDDFALLTMPEKEWQNSMASVGDIHHQGSLYLALKTKKVVCEATGETPPHADLPNISPSGFIAIHSYFATRDEIVANKRTAKKTLIKGMLRLAFALQAEKLLQHDIRGPALSYMLEGALSQYDPAIPVETHLGALQKTYYLNIPVAEPA